ncbi:hypothetical protein AH4AK4_2369 [Aeromonas hydrophila 4AK4]|nr:hypothetical protein AH4AK4_2369 [Aeromonas hydrophila 4AK4]
MALCRSEVAILLFSIEISGGYRLTIAACGQPSQRFGKTGAR